MIEIRFDQDELKRVMSVRERIIHKFVNRERAGNMIVATRGLVVGLLSSDSTYTVSVTGTSDLHDYIVMLEELVADKYGINDDILMEAKSADEQKPELRKVECSRCLGQKFIRASGKRSIKTSACPVCNGKGFNYVEVNDV